MGKAGTKNLDFMMLAVGILKRNASSSMMKSEHLPLTKCIPLASYCFSRGLRFCIYKSEILPTSQFAVGPC